LWGGKHFSLSQVSTYRLSDRGFSETLLFQMVNNAERAGETVRNSEGELRRPHSHGAGAERAARCLGGGGVGERLH